MPRRRPERYQLAFDLGKKTEFEASPTNDISGLLAGLGSREGVIGRFVTTVREEVILRGPAEVGAYLLQHVFTPFEEFEQEELWVLMLNTKNRLTHESLVYRGWIDSIPVRLSEVYRPAVRVNARSIILSHCHPSGDPTPSPEDVRVTSEALQAGLILGIELLDHVIVGHNRWISLKERGLGF